MKKITTEIPDHQRDFILNLAGTTGRTIKEAAAYVIEMGIDNLRKPMCGRCFYYNDDNELCTELNMCSGTTDGYDCHIFERRSK